MKKSFYLASAAIVASMLFSCNKFEAEIKPADESTIKVELTANTADTKVTIGSQTAGKYPVTWNAEGETVVMYEVTPDGSKSYLSAEEYTLSTSNKTAKFEFEVEAKEAASYDYYFFSPAAVIGGFASGKFNIKLPASQKSGATSVDPASIILQATALGQTSQAASINAGFKMISAVGKMTLKNLPLGTGESVNSVSIQAPGKDLAATTNLSTDGTFTHNNGATDKITVDVSGLTTTGNFDVWFNCWPCSLAAGEKLVITANTDDAIYTREITLSAAKEFKAGAVNTITVDMANAEKPEIIEYKLTNLGSISASDVVVITMKIGDKYYAMSNDKGTTAAPAAVLVEVKNNAISTPAENLKWNITSSEGAYVINVDGDASKVLYTTDTNNGVRVDTKSGASWVLDNDYLKFNKVFTNNVFRYLGVYDKADWRTYSNTTGNIKEEQVCFFAYGDTREAQSLSFPQATYEVEAGDTFTAPVLSGVKTSVTYTSSNTEVATVDASTGAVSIVAAGTTTITANAAADATYKAGTASYTLKVISSEVLQTIDQIFAAATKAGSTATSVKIKFNNWVITGVKGKNAYATDGTKGFIIYKDGHGFESGDKLSGTVTCKVQLYNGSAELTDITSATTGLTVTKGGTFTAQSATITGLSGVNTGAYIDLGTLEYKDGVFTDGTNTIKPYASVIDFPTLSAGNYSVKGMYVQFNSTREIAPLYNTDFELVDDVEPTCATPVITINGSGLATITCETAGATIKYAISDTEPANFTNTYSAPVQLTSGQTIWAKAIKDSMQDSKVASKKYVEGETTVTKLISEISGTTENGTKVSVMTLDDVITASASESGNNGKVYGDGAEWRLYQSNSGTVTITAASGHSITSVNFTFTVENTGCLKCGDDQLTSGTAYSVSGSSATFSVGNTGTKTNGQVKITKIEVKYQ